MRVGGMMRSTTIQRRTPLRRGVGKRRMAQRPVTNLAKGCECQVRLPGICNGDPATTQPAHYRMHGLSGCGYIAEPIFVAWACSACHQYADTHSDPETRLALAEGVFRTQAELLRREVIIVCA